MSDWNNVVRKLADEGVALAESAAPAGDVGRNAAWRADSGEGPVFLKTCPAAESERLAAEADGLRALAATGSLRLPRVLALIETEKAACLALEWLSLEQPDGAAEARFGAALAALHRHTAERFGWHRDNTIGLTPQINTPDDEWIRFWRVRRLGYQLELAARRGYGGELQEAGRRLIDNLDRLLAGHAPPASLLHGDLWAGNRAMVAGRPAVFDPAVYYGDRETDLAMTRLFGGFGPAFYRAYDDAWPLPTGHEQRLALYQLYHVLNHLNLFGTGYLGQALDLVRRLNGY